MRKWIENLIKLSFEIIIKFFNNLLINYDTKKLTVEKR